MISDALGSVRGNYSVGLFSGSNSVGRVTAFQAVGREFESRLPLFFVGGEFKGNSSELRN